MSAIARSSRSLACRICEGQGSSYEKQLYRLLGGLDAVRAFAAEAYAVAGEYQQEGLSVNLNRHSWDILTLEPANLLIEVQGEQHSDKLMTKPNCADDTLQERSSRDAALRAGAVQQGFYVLWLLPGDERGRTRRWKAAILKIINSMKDKVPPYHAWA